MVSRRTDQIVSGGENIDPSEIVNKLSSIKGIEEAVVIPLPNKEWGEVPIAAIVTDPEAELNEAAVIEELKLNLSSFKIPKRIIAVEAIPRNDLGKVEMEKLKSLLKFD